MSNYETMFWQVFTDGMNRIKSSSRAFLGIVGGSIAKFFETPPSVYMAIPILWYILALYTRSQKTNVIFGFRTHPGYATMKLGIFVNALVMYMCAKNGYINIDMAACLENVLILLYGLVIMYQGYVSVKINKESFDKVFYSIYGHKTEEDIEAEKRLFKSL